MLLITTPYNSCAQRENKLTGILETFANGVIGIMTLQMGSVTILINLIYEFITLRTLAYMYYSMSIVQLSIHLLITCELFPYGSDSGIVKCYDEYESTKTIARNVCSSPGEIG